MVKPDIIVTQPYSIDYPLWRAFIQDNRDLFDKVILGYYQDWRKFNFKDFIMQAMPDAVHVDCGVVPGNKDWRDWCVNAALKESKSDWVLFLETDFIASSGFYRDVFTIVNDYDVVGYSDKERTTSWQGNTGDWSSTVRLHPAYILVSRSLIDQTSKDFGAHPDKDRDHFGVFTEELYHLKPRFYDLNKRSDWKHYAGLYSNYMLVQAGNKPNYKPEEFKQYVKLAMNAPVIQDPRFLEWSNECLS